MKKILLILVLIPIFTFSQIKGIKDLQNSNYNQVAYNSNICLKDFNEESQMKNNIFQNYMLSSDDVNNTSIKRKDFILKNKSFLPVKINFHINEFISLKGLNKIIISLEDSKS